MKAVIDTNVLAAARLAKNSASTTVRILRAIVEGRFTPLYAPDIIAEHREVLARPHFHFNLEAVTEIINRIVALGLPIASRRPSSVRWLGRDIRLQFDQLSRCWTIET